MKIGKLKNNSQKKHEAIKVYKIFNELNRQIKSTLESKYRNCPLPIFDIYTYVDDDKNVNIDLKTYHPFGKKLKLNISKNKTNFVWDSSINLDISSIVKRLNEENFNTKMPIFYKNEKIGLSFDEYFKLYVKCLLAEDVLYIASLLTKEQVVFHTTEFFKF